MAEQPIYGSLSEAVDDVMRQLEVIKELKAKLAQARMNNTKLRQVLKNILIYITQPELRGTINHVLQDTGGRR